VAVPKTKIFSFFFIIFFIFNCQRRIIKKDELELLNEYYGQKTFYLKDKVYITNKEFLEKGTSVKIWVESTSSLLKIKCYPSQGDRESAVGKMVSYLINEELKDNSFTIEDLETMIDEKLTFYVPQNVKRVVTPKK
jgi:type II secretion system-associated lipoprotein